MRTRTRTPRRTRRSAAALAAVTTIATTTGLLGAPTATADPTTLFPVTAGTLGNYTYDFQVGPGTGYGDEPAICTSVTMSHVTDITPAEPLVSCRTKDYSRLVGDGRVLNLEGHAMAAGEDPFLNVDLWATTPKAQRIKVKAPEHKVVTVTKASSKVISIDGERVRFFHLARLDHNPRRSDSVKAQVRKCRKVTVKGKKRKKCSWKTIADHSYTLVR